MPETLRLVRLFDHETRQYIDDELNFETVPRVGEILHFDNDKFPDEARRYLVRYIEHHIEDDSISPMICLYVEHLPSQQWYHDAIEKRSN